MSRISLSVVALSLVVSACEGRPDRAEIDQLPSAAADTAAAPIPNNCKTRTHEFEVTATGYLEQTYKGYGVFAFEGNNDPRTAFILQVCDGGEVGAVVGMNFFDNKRVRKGTYDIVAADSEAKGFVFTFTDERLESAIDCSNLPTGEVVIETSKNDEIIGSFDVAVNCIDFDVKDEHRRPQPTRIAGTFKASNIGTE